MLPSNVIGVWAPVVVVIVTVLLICDLLERRSAHRRTMARRRVVVNLTTGSSLSGLVWAKRGRLLVLRDAQLLEGRGPVPVDGEVVIEVDRIDFTQVLP